MHLQHLLSFLLCCMMEAQDGMPYWRSKEATEDSMKVILKTDVKGIGKAGTTREVSDGYAMNFLIPRGLAQPASEGAQKQLDLHQKAAARREKEEHSEAEELAQVLSALELVFTAKAGENDRLYGSITSADVAEQIAERAQIDVDKRKIVLDEPIRQLGRHKVTVKLATDVNAEVTVNVEREE
jgi:large subunit ribosomal protein L9